MFSVDEATAEAIRRAYEEGGELAGVVEFRRHFPLITDNAKAGGVRADHRRVEAVAGAAASQRAEGGQARFYGAAQCPPARRR